MGDAPQFANDAECLPPFRPARDRLQFGAVERENSCGRRCRPRSGKI